MKLLIMLLSPFSGYFIRHFPVNTAYVYRVINLNHRWIYRNRN